MIDNQDVTDGEAGESSGIFGKRVGTWFNLIGGVLQGVAFILSKAGSGGSADGSTTE